VPRSSGHAATPIDGYSRPELKLYEKQAVETFRRIGVGELTGYTAMDIMRDLKLPD